MLNTDGLGSDVFLAGVEVGSDSAIELAARLTHSGATLTAALLLAADAEGKDALDLTINDRETILLALEKDPPNGLVSLREVLLEERRWRQRQAHS